MQIHPTPQSFGPSQYPPHTGADVVVVVVGGSVVVVVVVDVVEVVVVDVVVVDVVVVLVVVVVDPTHTNNELDNKYTFPPLSPVSPLEPVGTKEYEALGTKEFINDELTA